MKASGMAKITCIFLLAGSIAMGNMAVSLHAGIISKPAIWVGKKTVKTVGKKSLRKAAIVQAEKDIKHIAAKYGDEVVRKIGRIAYTTGIPKEQIAHELRYYGRHYRRAGFSEEAIVFGIKNGQAGRFFVSRPELYEALKKSSCLGEDSEAIIKESWRLVRGTGGSWKELRIQLTLAGKNSGVSRDFCETLFENQVKSGRMPQVFPKGTQLFSGHISKGANVDEMGESVRQGVDFVLPQKDGPLRIIEFGTGKKPISMEELGWERIRSNMAQYMEQAQNKDQLRAAGIRPVLLNPDTWRDNNFPIHKYVDREIYAPEIDKALVAKMYTAGEESILAVELP